MVCICVIVVVVFVLNRTCHNPICVFSRVVGRGMGEPLEAVPKDGSEESRKKEKEGDHRRNYCHSYSKRWQGLKPKLW